MLTFKPIKDDDLSDLAALSRGIWTDSFSEFLPPEQVEYMKAQYHTEDSLRDLMKRKGQRYYYIISGTAIAGYFVLSPHGDSLAIAIFITREFRGKGLGKQALKRIYKMCKEEGYRKVLVAVNKNNAPAVKAFTRSGLKIVGTRVTDVGGGFVMSDYLMEKKL